MPRSFRFFLFLPGALAVLGWVALLCWLVPAKSSVHQTQIKSTGKLVGRVYNVASGEPLTKAGVEIAGKDGTIYTGLGGEFSIHLDAGNYAVRIFHDGFLEQTVSNVEIVAGSTRELNAVLSPVGYGETITINAQSGSDVVGLLEERKAATAISDTISATEIKNDTASNAAGVLQRAPGISIVDRFVFVRGLGERYSNTSLNDALLPTTEPDRKVVPMDLIPASLLESVKIFKTFTPDQPGEFSGGLVRLETVDLPRARTLSFSFSTGSNSATHRKDFLTYPAGGARDFFGLGRARRALPDGIPQNERLLRGNQFLPGGFTPTQLETIGESFENVWSPAVADARPDLGWTVAGGNTFGKFGLVGALSFKNESQSLDEIRNFFQIAEAGRIRPSNTYDYTSSTRTARMGATFNTAYQVDQNHRILFKNFLTNQASDETRIFQGFNEDRGTDLRNTRLRYIEERIYTGQFSGNHLIKTLGDSILNWRLTYSRATLDEPDLRETLYEFSPASDDFIYFNQTQSLFRLFNAMRENVREPAADWAKYWFFKGFSLNTKAGFSYTNRDRVFDSRRFRFVPRSTAGIDLSQSPEALLTPANIGQDSGFEIREETRTTDHYDALHDIKAGYLMADLVLKRWRFVGGARVEQSEQRVQTFEPFRADIVPVLANLKNTDILPSLGLVYALKNGSMNLRLGYSKTLARPQFRELSPFEFTDVTGGRSAVGNPDIMPTSISNYDVRWEWFVAPAELLAVSVFHKDLRDPIEIVVQAQTTLLTSFRNADRARNTGLEIEFRKNLGALTSYFSNLSINTNYTFVRSRVDIGEQNRSILTNLKRPLVGQAENVLNLALSYEVPRFAFNTRALFNFTGSRISDVGALGLPDIIEHSYPHFDLLFAKRFGTEKRWRAEATIENVLNRQVDYRLDNQPFRVYRSGRTFSFGVSYTVY